MREGSAPTPELGSLEPQLLRHRGSLARAAIERPQPSGRGGRRQRWLLGVGLLLACGGTPPAQSAATAADSAPAPLAVVVPPPREVVPIPENTVAWGRIPRPGQTIDTTLSWSGLPLDWQSLLSGLDGPAGALLPLVDWTAPVDAVVTIDPEARGRPRFFVAGALGLSSAEATVKALATQEVPVRFVEPGVYAFTFDGRFECLISAATFGGRDQLVCSDAAEALQQLHPYLARGARPPGADAVDATFEVVAPFAWQLFEDKAPLLQRGLPLLLSELSTGDLALDSAIREAALATGTELVTILADLDRIRLALELSQPQQALIAELSTRLRDRSSGLAALLASAAERKAPAPALFWQLPGSAQQVLYCNSTAPVARQTFTHHLTRSVQAALTFAGASSEPTARLSRAIEAASELEGAVVFAQGTSNPAQAPPDSAPRKPPTYGLVGFEKDESNAIGALVEALAGSYEDPGLRAGLERRLEGEGVSLPQLRRDKGSGPLARSTFYELPIPPELLGEAEDEPSPAGARAPAVSLFFASLHANGTSWLGASTSKKLLQSRLAEAVSPGPRSDALAARPELAPFRTTAASCQGVWTLAAVLDQIAAAKGSSKASRLAGQVGPAAASVPISYLLDAQLQQPGVSARYRIAVPARLLAAIGGALSQ